MFRRKTSLKASAAERVKASKAFFKKRVEDSKTPSGKLARTRLPLIGTGYYNKVRVLSDRLVVKNSRNDTDFARLHQQNYNPVIHKLPSAYHKKARGAGLPVPKYYFTQVRFGEKGLEHSSVHERVQPIKNWRHAKKSLKGIMSVIDKSAKKGLIIDAHAENFGVKREGLFKRERVKLLDVEPIHDAKTMRETDIRIGLLKRLKDQMSYHAYKQDSSKQVKRVTKELVAEFKKQVIKKWGRKAWREFESPESQEWRKVLKFFD